MATSLLGKKIGMTQLFDESGACVPVTLVEIGPCTVMQIKTKEKDGYEALQLGFEDRRRVTATQPAAGHAKAAKTEPKHFVREVPKDGDREYERGDVLTIDEFEEVNSVDIIGKTKGRGFTGGIKRWNFRIGPHSHGSSNGRNIGSIGMHTFPGRVFKGKKMPGQYGNEKITVKNLKVVKVDKERNLLLIKGSVQGPNGGYVVVRPTNKV